MKVAVFRTTVLCAAAGCMLFASSKVCLGAADILIYPTRVIMTDRLRTAQVDVINTSQTQASYKISLVRRRMTDAGEFQDVQAPEAEEKFADEVVKYSPRQVTLVSGAGQTIRMMFKIPSDLAEGEYRSHLVVTKMPSGISGLPEKDQQDPNAVTLRLTPIVGISIPVIARHGKLEAKAAIDPSSVKVTAVEPKQQLVGLTLARTGTRSIYGNVVVYRGEEKVAEGNGLAVYTPNRQRKIGVHVLDPYQLKSGENIRVVFTEKDEKKPMAETTIILH